MRIEVSIDLARFTAQSDAYVSKRLQPALQEALDYLAASARKRLQESTQAYFQDLVAWTQQTFAYRRVNAGADIAATLAYLLLNQACYLGIEVFGCVRHAGDYATTNRGPSPGA
ncbi:MAG: hypothetical protein WAP03_22520 [Methylorubrum rhodinum]|uniref:hypothetical protein n=1 Tax=Methylorubrum rhodinum TaxID=29428 RepID=UPI003BAF5F43